MTRLLSSYAFGIAALFAVLSPISSYAQAVSASASYIVSLGGVNISTISVDLADDGSRYTLDLEAKVTGLGGLVSSGTARIKSSGIASSPGLTSEKFGLVTRANGEDFKVDVTYANRQVSTFVVNPPLVDNTDRIAIERSHLSNVGDILASFVFKGGALDKALCQRKLQIFTGVERFNVNMGYAGEDTATSPRTGYQGPVVLCNIRYVPVSGHFTSSELTDYLADSDRILIWYAPLAETGYFIPYRVLMPTNFGDLSMVLTAVKP